MSCEHCGGSGWVTVETPTASFAKRCACYQPPTNTEPQGTQLRENDAIAQVEVLCGTLAFAPPSGSRSMIVKAVMSMCRTVEQLEWLTERACELHTEWKTCGIRGLRQIISSRWTPKDGLVITSTEAYPEGIPSSRKEPEPLRLPPGTVASADLEMDQSIQRLAQVKSMGRPAPINPNFKPLTQADIDKAREEWAAKKAREEREGSS